MFLTTNDWVSTWCLKSRARHHQQLVLILPHDLLHFSYSVFPPLSPFPLLSLSLLKFHLSASLLLSWTTHTKRIAYNRSNFLKAQLSRSSRHRTQSSCRMNFFGWDVRELERLQWPREHSNESSTMCRHCEKNVSMIVHMTLVVHAVAVPCGWSSEPDTPFCTVYVVNGMMTCS